jgi:tRNA-modifying protein YgfZ
MTSARIAPLPDRGVVRVTGADAEKLLQGIVSNDMEQLGSQPAIHTALLTPQGKILFDFFVVRTGDGFLLEVARDKAADLAKRLALYRLRAKVAIADDSESWRVFALWGDLPKELPWNDDVADDRKRTGVPPPDIGMLCRYADPRFAELGERWIFPKNSVAQARLQLTNVTEVPLEDYHAHRIALGVPEGGKDYVLGDTFPHEADLDQLNGVSFSKGCFVGQEVVSRMQNRGSVRKRVMPIEGEAPLAPGAEIKTGAASIGTVGSAAGRLALALIRLDRAAEAKAKGQALTADGVAVTLCKPDWATFELTPAAAAEAP